MVYLANDLRLERRVAIKVMHGHLVEDESFIRRFEQEARSAARLAHPGVVGVFDQGIDAGLPYLVMEYLPGITLRELLKQQRRLTQEQTLEIGEAVLAGLAAAHDAGIVHRDLKPENVLLADDGRIKIGDFGLARAVSANTTTGQALLGTIAYLSPELVTRGVADARSDLYAFGIMLFEMITGQQPFKGEQAMQIAYQHAHGEVPHPSTLVPEVDPELDELVRWLTARDPENRPRDGREALEHLRRLHGGSGATRVLPVTGIIAESVTPSTTVLSEVDRHALASSEGSTAEAPEAPRTAADRVRAAARRRTTRGRWTAGLVILLLAAAGGTGWWWGQGPGSQITIPEVAGLSLDDATAALNEQDLLVDLFECSSLDIAEGLAVRTEPAAGSNADRGSTVRLCRSTGPELLPVPTLVGLVESQAVDAIQDAGFSFGEVRERRFDGGASGTVILAIDETGEGLGEQYPEQGRIDLIVSAGAIPLVDGSSPEAATQTLAAVGLTVDPALNTEAHHDDIPEGKVLAVITHTDPVRAGDTVGLQLSLGPQLFEVPNISGMGLQEAMDTLSAAGFEPTTAVPDALRPLARATSTSPAAGERLRAGTSIQVRATIAL